MTSAPPPAPQDLLVVFLKAPVPGRCKTRLTPPLTAEESAALYRAFCADVFASLADVPAGVLVAYDPAPGFPTPAWATDAPWVGQPAGDLGRRLEHAFAEAFRRGARRAVCLGTDAPTLPAEHLRAALDALERADAVLGPAEDGGYTLVGLRREAPGLFDGVPWSTDRALAATRDRLERRGLRAVLTPPHHDVDSFADLRRLAAELADPRAAARCPRTREALSALARHLL